MSAEDDVVTPPAAVVLVSGGLDSATVLAIAREQGYRLLAISFDYGQRHKFELSSAQRVCDFFGVEKHITVPLDLRSLGGSALTSELAVPKDRSASEMAGEIPVTYVPARNTVFLSVALGWAEVLGATDLFIGVNAVDYSGYPDCRPEFIAAFEQLANLATRVGTQGNRRFRIHTPLIDLTKAQIIARGMALGVDYALTTSCYDPDATGQPCGRCDACQLRLKGFSEAGLVDPVRYAPREADRA